MDSQDPIHAAVACLKQSLLVCIPEGTNLSQSVRDVQFSRQPAKSVDILTIHPGDSVAQVAQGGVFRYIFPGESGREAARIMDSVIVQAFSLAQWESMGDAAREKNIYKYSCNPIRIRNTNASDNGCLTFVVDDGSAGLLARRINELALAVKRHTREVSEVMTVAALHGPKSQEKAIARFFPCVEGLASDKPQVRLRIQVANHQQWIQTKLRDAGLVPMENSASFCKRDGDQEIAATEFIASPDQMGIVNGIFATALGRGGMSIY